MKNHASKEIEIDTEKEATHRLWVGRPFRPAQTSVVLLKAGSIEVGYNLTNYTLPPLTILLVSPNFVYEFWRIDPDAQMRVITIDPNFESIASVKIRLYETRSFFISTVQNHYSVAAPEFMELWNTTELLRGRLATPGKNRVKLEIIHHLFLSMIYLLADISKKYNQIKIDEIGRADNLTFDFTNLVSTHFRTERSVNFYADQLGISSKHLSETIKRCSGFTAGEIINQAILIEAKILLVNQNNTINQVARELNFSDQYAFSKFFKRLTQTSPSTFREKL